MNLTLCRNLLLLFGFLGAVHASAQINVNGKLYTLEESISAAQEQERQSMYREASAYLNAAANYLWEEKDYDRAIQLFEKSIEQNQKINNTSGVARIESNLGMIYADKGDYLKSLKYFEKTLAVREQEKERIAIINARINISVVLNRLNRYDEAIAHLQGALNLAIDMNDRDQIQSCYGMLAEAYDKKGDRKMSMQYFDYYKAMQQNIQSSHEKKVQAALEKINSDITLTQTEKEEKEVQLKLRERELGEKKKELERVDSTNQALQHRASEVEVKLELLQKEQAIGVVKRQEMEKRIKQERKFTVMAVAMLLISLMLLLLVGVTLRRNKRMNRLLTERNEVISRQKERLEEGNRVRTKLLSILSHDFRTPLSGVHLMVQLLRSKSIPPEILDKQLIKLDENLRLSFQMLENMLYWAKNQMNGIKYSPEPLVLSELVSDNMKMFSSSIADKEIVLENDVQPDELVYADKEMVNSIMRNLIANAVKFTPRKGTIRLHSEQSGGMVAFTVQDTGIGMTETQKEKIFTAEVQSTRGTEKESGSGLGLVLCHDFALACKGNISFQSEEGKGTCFKLELPAGALE